MTPAVWGALAVTAVLSVLAGQAMFGIWPTPALAGTSGCKDFFLISVRGSGEQFGRDAQDLSGSPETAAVRDGINQAFTNAGKKLDYEVENIDYPATAVDPMVDAFKRLGAAATAPAPPFVPPAVVAAVRGAQVAGAVAGVRGAIASYLAGEQRGEFWINDVVNRLTRQCNAVGRKTNLVLAGYSQGAMVIHNYLTSNQNRANIIGTVLIADPERTPNTGMHNYGSAYNSDPGSFGLCTVLQNLPSVPGRPSCLPNYAPAPAIPAGLRSSTVDVCANNDLVCETSHDVDLAHPSSFGSIDPGYKVHTGCNFYCGAPTRLAGQDMGRRALAANLAPTVPSQGNQGGGTTTPPAGGTTAPSGGPIFSTAALQGKEEVVLWPKPRANYSDIPGNAASYVPYVVAGDRVQLRCWVSNTNSPAETNGLYSTLWYFVSNQTRTVAHDGRSANVGYLNTYFIDDRVAPDQVVKGVPRC